MHHPGPPRFCSVGDYVELAPRDPDPDASYSWRIAQAPDASTASVGDGAVEYLQVDAAGTFVAELTALDGTYVQTFRVFETRPYDADDGEADDADDGEADDADDGGAGDGDDDDDAADDAADGGAGDDATGDERDGASDAVAGDGRAADGYDATPRTVGPPAGVSGVSGRSGGSGGDVLAGRRDDEDDEPAGRSYAGEADVAFSEQTGDGGRPRIRLDGRREDDDVVIEADPRPHPHGDETPSDLEVTFVLDDRDDLPREAVTVDRATLRVPLDRLPERARVHAVAVGEHGPSVADCVDVRRVAEGESAAGLDAGSVDDLTDVDASDDASDLDADVRDALDADGVAIHRPYDPPAWADDVVIYEIYVRTFAEDVDAETHFDAIAEKFDHLEALGVDVLWLTPVLQNDHAPHGYNITDFTSIAEDLGDREDYERFVERAHDRGFAVLFDLVCNHSARSHPFFESAATDPDGDYREWYEWQDSGEPGTYFDWEHIANFDFSHLPVRRHLLDAIDQWAPLVDGFRVDMAWAVPDGFWRELNDRLKARNSEFLLLDETIPYIPDFQEGIFDVHFDSTTYAKLRSVGTGYAPAEELLEAVDQRTAVGFPDHAGFMLYQENHDESRYRVECGREASLASAGALCTLPGAPLIYAGQELGQLGKRDTVVWDATDEALVEHYRRLTTARTSLPALRSEAELDRIDYEVREGDTDAVVAFRRSASASSGDGSVRPTAPHVDAWTDATPAELGVDDPASVDDAVVVLNFAEDPAVVDVGPTVHATDVLTGAPRSTDDGLRVDAVGVFPVASGGSTN